MYNLKGKTAVITGGKSGVGAATAMLFAKSGANVVISARRQAALDEVASKIKAEGGNVLTVLTDISKDEDCKNLMKATVDKFGGIDILVNNAGVLDTGLAPIDKFDDVEIQKLISINQVGTMRKCCFCCGSKRRWRRCLCFHQIRNHRYYKAYRFTSCRQIHSL